jgi:hypothetical protein
MNDEGAKQARLKYMIGIAHQSDTLDEFRNVVDGFTGDYDIRDCVWNIVDIAEMPMVGEVILDTRENVYSYSPEIGESVELDLLKTSNKKPQEIRRYLLVLHGTRVIACGARLSVGDEVAIESIATVGQERRGLASFLLDEVKTDFPEVAYKPPFSRQGFLFLIRQEGFADLSDFYGWARHREGWQP